MSDNTSNILGIRRHSGAPLIAFVIAFGLGAPAVYCRPPSEPVTNVKPQGCNDESKERKNLLFEDKECKYPIEPRYGDDELDTKGEMINPYVVYACPDVVKVTITEKKRKTRIQQDFEAVIDSASSGIGVAETSCRPFRQDLQFSRGTLAVKAVDEQDAVLQENSVITGPKDHWFLGLDLPVTSHETLKYDAEANALVPKEKDVQLYLSLNYLFGDVLVDMKEEFRPVGWDDFFDNLSLKLFVRASSRPLDSAGVGLGWRVPRLKIKKFDLDVSGLSIYGGYFWTKEDAIEGGTPVTNGARDEQWRFGVTFDVESMIKSVKW